MGTTLHCDCHYDGVLYFELDLETNLFYDQCGMRVDDMFEILTPNDLYLFRESNVDSLIFRHRHDRNILCDVRRR